jgi:hypothetical protein
MAKKQLNDYQISDLYNLYGHDMNPLDFIKLVKSIEDFILNQ